MGRLTFTRVILKRITADWKLLLTVFAGVVLSTTIGAGTPIYLDSLEQLAFNASIDRLDAPSVNITNVEILATSKSCLLYTSPSPRDGLLSRMPSSA